MSEDEECALCKTQLIVTPSMVLLTSICGHKICESCCSRAFMTSQILLCPVCKIELRKYNFTDEGSAVAREIAIRRRIEREFNKRPEDFKTDREYNDYLEFKEDIIFNLNTQTNVEEMEALIKKNRDENADLIARNQSKRAAEEEAMAKAIEDERAEMARLRSLSVMHDRAVEQEREAERRHLIDGLSEGKRISSVKKEIKSMHKKAMNKLAKQEETASNVQEPPAIIAPSASSYMPVTQTLAPVTRPLTVAANSNDYEKDPMSEQAQRAGGFDAKIVQKRCIEAALNELFV